MTDQGSDASHLSRFHLSKWYLDCIADNGDGAVLYLAQLRWKKWHVRYSYLMLFIGDTVTSKTSLRSCELPDSSNDRIAVKNAHLAFEGTWTRRAAPIERKVYAEGEQDIVWNCLQPASDVTLLVNGSTEIRGLGYAELLEMSIAPWKLPLSELHWGRWISPRNHVVWIDWRGRNTFCLLLHNGTCHEPKTIGESAVATADLRLTLDRGLVLRSGHLGKTVLPTLARVLTFLPDAVFRIDECKWRSRGVLTASGGVQENGWAIHEIVRWPKK